MSRQLRNEECGGVTRFSPEQIAELPADERPGPGQLPVKDPITQDWVDEGDEIAIDGVCVSKSNLRLWLESLADRTFPPTFPATNEPLTAEQVREIGIDPQTFRAFRTGEPDAAPQDEPVQIRDGPYRRAAPGTPFLEVPIEEAYVEEVFFTDEYRRHAVAVRGAIINALVGGFSTAEAFDLVLSALNWRVLVDTDYEVNTVGRDAQPRRLRAAVTYDAERDNLLGALRSAEQRRNTVVRRLLGWFDPALWQLVVLHLATTYRRPNQERLKMTWSNFEQLLRDAFEANNIPLLQLLLANRFIAADVNRDERIELSEGMLPSVEFCQSLWPDNRNERATMYSETRRLLLDGACGLLGTYHLRSYNPKYALLSERRRN